MNIRDKFNSNSRSPQGLSADVLPCFTGRDRRDRHRMEGAMLWHSIRAPRSFNESARPAPSEVKNTHQPTREITTLHSWPFTAGQYSLFSWPGLKRPPAHDNAICRSLTPRQRDVLALMVQGKSNKAICRVLNLAEPTVKNHVTAILKALKVTNRTEAVIKVSETAVALLSFASTISGYRAFGRGA